jgi:Uma2 family endonuclease
MTTLHETTIFSRWTNAMVESMPRVEGERYEIIDGELYVATQPHFRHQATSDNIAFELGAWSRKTGAGRIFTAPGVIFAEDNAVAPDLVWLSKARMPNVLGPDGKLHDAPDLAIEILSPGKANEERDRDKKLALYSRQGVPEYWIVDWRAETVEIYRRNEEHLQRAQTLKSGDEITSPLLPGFACGVERFFEL